MIAAFLIVAALLAAPDGPSVADACRPADLSVTPILEGGKLVLPPTELARIQAVAGSAGAGQASVAAKAQGPHSNAAVVLVSDALSEAGAERVDITIRTGPRGGFYLPLDTPSLAVSVSVTCGA